MRSLFGGLAVLALVIGCSSATQQRQEQAAGGTDRTMLTKSQFESYHFNTAYDAVESLRSNWLNSKGADSFRNPSQVRVYLDDVSFGDISTLRSISMADVVYLKHYDGVSASSRWGLGHGAGVIYVSTRPLSAPKP